MLSVLKTLVKPNGNKFNALLFNNKIIVLQQCQKTHSIKVDVGSAFQCVNCVKMFYIELTENESITAQPFEILST